MSFVHSAEEQPEGAYGSTETDHLEMIAGGIRLGWQLDAFGNKDAALLTLYRGPDGKPVDGTCKLFQHTLNTYVVFGIDHMLTPIEAEERLSAMQYAGNRVVRALEGTVSLGEADG